MADKDLSLRNGWPEPLTKTDSRIHRRCPDNQKHRFPQTPRATVQLRIPHQPHYADELVPSPGEPHERQTYGILSDETQRIPRRMGFSLSFGADFISKTWGNQTVFSRSSHMTLITTTRRIQLN